MSNVCFNDKLHNERNYYNQTNSSIGIQHII